MYVLTYSNRCSLYVSLNVCFVWIGYPLLYFIAKLFYNFSNLLVVNIYFKAVVIYYISMTLALNVDNVSCKWYTNKEKLILHFHDAVLNEFSDQRGIEYKKMLNLGKILLFCQYTNNNNKYVKSIKMNIQNGIFVFH